MAIIRDKDTQDRMLKLLETHTYQEVANLLGVSWPSYIRDTLRHLGIKRLPRNRRTSSGSLKVDEEFFSTVDTPCKAYWLGYLAADGCLRPGKVTLSSKDEEVVARFAADISSEHKVARHHIYDHRTQRTYTRYDIQVSNTKFVNNLVASGLPMNKTDCFSMPDMPPILLPYFLAGLFDGDGSIGRAPNGRLWANLISTKEVLDYIQELIRIKAGFPSVKIHRVTRNKENVWKLYLCRSCEWFMDYIYCDEAFPYLSRKKQIYDEYKNNRASGIISGYKRLHPSVDRKEHRNARRREWRHRRKSM